MNRRELLTMLGAGLLTVPLQARSQLLCGPFVPPGIQQCQVGIDSNIADATVADQQNLSQWCWAACIHMVFRYYGFYVTQERIVQETWGEFVNFPAQPSQLLGNLNRQWIDSNGRRFGVFGDVLTANPITAAQDLAQNMPLIIGTMGHAMVLTSLTYVRDQIGNGEVKVATVRDPWPERGKRMLSPQEWYGTNFLARVRVFPV